MPHTVPTRIINPPQIVDPREIDHGSRMMIMMIMIMSAHDHHQMIATVHGAESAGSDECQIAAEDQAEIDPMVPIDPDLLVLQQQGQAASHQAKTGEVRVLQYDGDVASFSVWHQQMIAYAHQNNLMHGTDLIASNFLQQRLKPKLVAQLMLDVTIAERKGQKLTLLTFGQQMGLLRRWFEPKEDSTSYVTKLKLITWDGRKETLKDVIAQIMHANALAHLEIDCTPFGLSEIITKVVPKNYGLANYITTRMDQKQVPHTFQVVLADAVDYMMRNMMLQSVKQVFSTSNNPQNYQPNYRPHFAGNFGGNQSRFRGGPRDDFWGRSQGFGSTSPTRRQSPPPGTNFRRSGSPTGSVQSGQEGPVVQQGGGEKHCFNCSSTQHLARNCTRERMQTGGI